MASREDAKDAKGQPDVEELSAIVVDAAFRIHKEMGPGLLESVYESVLAHALVKRRLGVERQKAVSFEYDGMRFDDGLRVDLLVNDVGSGVEVSGATCSSASQTIIDLFEAA